MYNLLNKLSDKCSMSFTNKSINNRSHFLCPELIILLIYTQTDILSTRDSVIDYLKSKAV